MPFLTEEIYQNLAIATGVKNSKESIHLELYPEIDNEKIDKELLGDMQKVRNICSNGLKIREDKGLKLRQPLSKAYTAVKDDFLQDIIKAELNVKEIEKSEEPIEGENLETNGEHEEYVTLDVELTQDLLFEGYVNDFIRQYQNARKRGDNIDYGDSVKLTVCIEDKKIREVIKKYIEEKSEDLDILKLEFVDELKGKKFKLAESEVVIEVEKI
jgi:isoleucyl-tRNA synthetase